MLAGLPIVWVGKNPNKGLAVVSFTGSCLELDPSYKASNQFVVPVHVNGTKSFRLLATWDHNDRTEGLNRRVGPLLRRRGAAAADYRRHAEAMSESAETLLIDQALFSVLGEGVLIAN